MESKARAHALLLGVFALAVLAGATLVFLVQPMAARLLLPRFGGSPAVWTTSLLFFQAALLVGYGWAHVSTSRLGVRRQQIAQIALLVLPLLLLPVALPAWSTPPEGVEPSWWLLLVLAAMVGPPYVVVTTMGPVLQRWFAGTTHPQAGDPYFLYAMGNAGSLFGLLAYPFLIEPNFALDQQALLWAGGYVLLVVLAGAAAILARRSAASRAEPADARPAATGDALPVADATVAADSPVASGPVANGPVAADGPSTRDPRGRPTARRRLTWVAYAFVPSSLMLGVTTYIAADLAAVPLLWVLPLSLYLITFIIAFSPRNPLTASRLAAALPIVVVILGVSMVGALQLPLVLLVGINLAAFFVAGLLAHVRLADDRPAPRHLTEFYLLLAVGGVLGGLFNALLAPTLFDNVLEYPLAITLALALRPGRPEVDPGRERRARRLDLLVPLAVFVGLLVLLVSLSRALDEPARAMAWALALAAVATLAFVRRPVRYALATGVVLLVPLIVGQGALFVDRGFFGINRVVEQGDVRLIVHGTTTHGGQLTVPGRRGEPLTYYHRTGPFGQAMQAFLGGRPGPVRIGVIGLGAGGIAAYARPGDSITFFEIDPIVVRIAEDPALFTFLSDTAAATRVVLGDGRLTVEQEPPGSFDVFVLDAFSGDAPPAHLLTVESFELYRRMLAPDGMLLVNVSNRYIDLEGVVVAALRALGMPARATLDASPGTPPAPEKEVAGWIASAHDDATLAGILGSVRTSEPGSAATLPWTDDFSDLVSVIRWGR